MWKPVNREVINMRRMSFPWNGKPTVGIFLVLLTTGLKAQLVTQPDTDECVLAAMCDLTKGDLMIEDVGDPGSYHDNAKLSLEKSIKYKNCSLTEILEKCKRRRRRCEADINIIARNIYGISMDLLQACPYITWPYMLFGCQNYGDWPTSLLNAIPLVCRNCLSRCYLVDAFEAALKDSGRADDFPEDWELTRNWSRIIKSSNERPKNNQFIYPWNNTLLWKPEQVRDHHLSKSSDLHGILADTLYCPYGLFVDVVEESGAEVSLRGRRWTYSTLRFGCSPVGLLSKNIEKQLWMLPLDAGKSNAARTNFKQISCWESGKDQFVIGMQCTTVGNISLVNSTWTFACGSGSERRIGQTMCPPSTAVCSVQPVYSIDPGFQDVLSDVHFGCCTIPKVVPGCERPSFEITKIESSCIQVNHALQNCSYTAHSGLIVNGSLDTTRQTTTEAELFERILETFGRYDTRKYLDRFDWYNTPRNTGRLVETLRTFEVVESNGKFVRHHAIIKCGIHSLYARSHIKQFLNITEELVTEYNQLIDLGCSIAYAPIHDVICENIFDCTTTISDKIVKPCGNCTFRVRYGIFSTRMSEPFDADGWSKRFDNLLTSYRLAGFVDTFEWINTPKANKLASLPYSEIRSAELIRVTPARYRQPIISCGGWNLRSKNIVDSTNFVNTTRRSNRKIRKIILQEVELILGCKPALTWDVSNGTDCIELPLKFQISCHLLPQFGYSLLPNVTERRELSLEKLKILGEIAKDLSPRSNIFDWESIANVPLIMADDPTIIIPREKYAANLQTKLLAPLPIVSCGGYKITANFIKDFGCHPVEQIEPFLPVCKGCTLNPNWNSLSGKDIDKYYVNCGPLVECTWRVIYGWTNSNRTDTIEVTRKKLNNLVLVASEFSAPSTRRPSGIRLDWRAVISTERPTFITVTHPGPYDKFVFTPTVKCGSITLYSRLHDYNLFKDDLGT